MWVPTHRIHFVDVADHLLFRDLQLLLNPFLLFVVVGVKL